MKPGDLAVIREDAARGRNEVRFYRTFPGVYGFHTVVFVPTGSVFLLIERRDTFWHVCLAGVNLWIDDYKIESVDRRLNKMSTNSVG